MPPDVAVEAAATTGTASAGFGVIAAGGNADGGITEGTGPRVT